MSNYSSLKATIDANIKANDNQEITGQILNSVLNDMVSSLGAGYLFKGVATTSTNPGTPDEKIFYLAFATGTYTYFGNTVIGEGQIGVFSFGSSWTYAVQSVSAAIADNLTTNDPSKALSAKQGYILNGIIGDLANLNTEDKASIVAAINEVVGNADLANSVLFLTLQDIFAIVDPALNIGAFVDSRGVHAPNILEYELITI